MVFNGGSLCRVGLQKRKLIPISDVQRLAVCVSTNVYVLHTCGDAEACLSSFHFYLRLWLSHLVKKIILTNISNVFVNKLHTH